MTYDGEQVLNGIFLDIRTLLTYFSGMTMLAKGVDSKKVPIIIMLWLDKWSPYIKLLKQEERDVLERIYDDNNSVDFELTIINFGKKMDDIAIMCTEMKELPLTDWYGMEQVIMAVQRLEGIRQEIQSGYYKNFFGV